MSTASPAESMPERDPRTVPVASAAVSRELTHHDLSRKL